MILAVMPGVEHVSPDEGIGDTGDGNAQTWQTK